MPESSTNIGADTIPETNGDMWVVGENSLYPTLEGNGRWWSPSYYVFIFTVVLTFIMSILLLVKRYKPLIVFFIFITTIISIYIQTRTSTCLWKGGCRIFSIIHLLQPLVIVIALLFIDTILLLTPSDFRNIDDTPPTETE